MSEIVFFLEESSAEAMLEGLLPRLLPHGWRHRCVVFEGKQDLDQQLVKRMRGYLVPNAFFVILRDQDAGDCRKIKSNLIRKCSNAGKPRALVRIACHELESWYLADLAAVEKGMEIEGLSCLQMRKSYRNPDDYPCPSRYLLKIAPGYQKVGCSRLIGPHLDLDNRRSHSFSVFVSGVRRLIGEYK